MHKPTHALAAPYLVHAIIDINKVVRAAGARISCTRPAPLALAEEREDCQPLVPRRRGHHHLWRLCVPPMQNCEFESSLALPLSQRKLQAADAAAAAVLLQLLQLEYRATLYGSRRAGPRAGAEQWRMPPSGHSRVTNSAADGRVPALLRALLLVCVSSDVAGGQCGLGDRAALASFYAATDGPGWRNSTGWNSAGDCCTWYGVSCAGGRVTSLCVTPRGPRPSCSFCVLDIRHNCCLFACLLAPQVHVFICFAVLAWCVRGGVTGVWHAWSDTSTTMEWGVRFLPASATSPH